MDPLVVTAGTAVVAAMATDAWQQARSAVVELWRRAHPERVPAIEGELAEVREEVLTARNDQNDQAEESLAADWRRRLDRLVRANPELAKELKRLLDEQLAPLLSPQGGPSGPGSRTNIAHTGNNSRVIQATGDITIGR
ncbi:hypothetical protein ABT063_01880 [Streptomyces sp. NPDC002838]|uniref:hypothetical protein n=1 Tax=Streptomyces sp. NPDC002838 TaxID=3154436 RepID=UPI0033178C19